MHEGAWEKTAALMAITANINRDEKKRREPYEPKDFPPTIFAEFAPVKPVHRPGMSAVVETLNHGRIK